MYGTPMSRADPVQAQALDRCVAPAPCAATGSLEHSFLPHAKDTD